MTSPDNSETKVVRGLSRLIAAELGALSHEYWAPRLGPDQSDSEMAFRRKRIEGLRRMRHEFENLMHGLEREVV